MPEEDINTLLSVWREKDRRIFLLNSQRFVLLIVMAIVDAVALVLQILNIIDFKTVVFVIVISCLWFSFFNMRIGKKISGIIFERYHQGGQDQM